MTNNLIWYHRRQLSKIIEDVSGKDAYYRGINFGCLQTVFTSTHMRFEEVEYLPQLRDEEISPLWVPRLVPGGDGGFSLGRLEHVLQKIRKICSGIPFQLILLRNDLMSPIELIKVEQKVEKGVRMLAA